VNVVKSSDAIICVSDMQRDLILKKVPALQSKTHVIPNPLPPLSYIEMIDDDFGYFGGPSLLKGWKTLLESLALLQSQKKCVRVHCTNFPVKKGRIEPTLGMIKIFIHSRVSASAYNELYRHLRAVIVPSVWKESFGYTAAEAIIRGRLLIKSDGACISEITDGCQGVFRFETGDHIGLVDCIDSVNNLSRGAACELGLKNRESLLCRWDNQKIERRLLGLFDDIAN
jgi:glycosyltransferase involved in cell wall biosynthesis